MLSFDRQLRALFSSTPASAFEGYAGKFMEGGLRHSPRLFSGLAAGV
jgi:hypothetical protein